MSHPYTSAELSYLREHYVNTSNEILGKVLNRNPRSVAQKARKMGLAKSAAYMAESSCRFAPGLTPWNKGVPVQVLRDASDALGNFISDHGWGDDDMQAMDNLDAYIARHDTRAQKGQP